MNLEDASDFIKTLSKYTADGELNHVESIIEYMSTTGTEPEAVAQMVKQIPSIYAKVKKDAEKLSIIESHPRLLG